MNRAARFVGVEGIRADEDAQAGTGTCDGHGLLLDGALVRSGTSEYSDSGDVNSTDPGPGTVINTVVHSEGEFEKLVGAWRKDSLAMIAAPGFISAQHYRGIVTRHHFRRSCPP